MKKYNIKFDFSDFGLIILIILCVGEPDLLDTIIHYLMK